MRKQKKIRKAPENLLDTHSEKRSRGRPARVGATVIRGRADNFRQILEQVWDRLWPRLPQARTDEEVINVFVEGASPYAQEFVPNLGNLISRVLREPKFPKRRDAQIGFLADSLAGLGDVTPRSSRDICQKERARERRAHRILRWEVYVECSCGFKGRSRDLACRKCGTGIDFGFNPMSVL